MADGLGLSQPEFRTAGDSGWGDTRLIPVRVGDLVSCGCSLGSRGEVVEVGDGMVMKLPAASKPTTPSASASAGSGDFGFSTELSCCWLITSHVLRGDFVRGIGGFLWVVGFGGVLQPETI